MDGTPLRLGPAAMLLVMFTGTLVGTLKDPAALAMMMALCSLAGILRWPKYMPLLMALVLAAFTFFRLQSWWAEIGVDPSFLERFPRIFGFRLLLAYIAYGIGFGISAFHRRRTNSP